MFGEARKSGAGGVPCRENKLNCWTNSGFSSMCRWGWCFICSLSVETRKTFRPIRREMFRRWRMRSGNHNSSLMFTISAWQTKIKFHFDDNVREARRSGTRMPLFHLCLCSVADAPKACAHSLFPATRNLYFYDRQHSTTVAFVSSD